MDNIKVTVIIPVYNCEKYIVRCLNSVLNQSYSNIETIVVDDGSTDDTESLCKMFIGNINFKYIKIENHGVSYARNCGIQNSDGALCFFVDADDCLEKDYCYKLVKTMLETKSDLVVCGYITESGNIKNKMTPHYGEYQVDQFLKEYISTPFINTPWGKVYKREFIMEEFNVNKNMGEDFEFNICYLKNINKICCIDQALYIYNLNNEKSLTKNIEKLGDAIYENCLVLINNFGFHHNLLRNFISRRVNDYIKLILNETSDVEEYKRLASVISNNKKLRSLIEEVEIFDLRVRMIINNHLILLKVLQKFILILRTLSCRKRNKSDE